MANSGQGTTFSFGGTSFTVTSITYSLNDVTGTTDEIDISHLGLTAGSNLLTMKRPLIGSAAGDTGKEVTMDFFGSGPISAGSSGTLTIAGSIVYSGTATCTSSSISVNTNDVVKGTATFKVS